MFPRSSQYLRRYYKVNMEAYKLNTSLTQTDVEIFFKTSNNLFNKNYYRNKAVFKDL